MKIITIILGLLVTAGGFYCLMTPGATFLSMGWVVGVLLVSSGINAIAAFIVGRKTKDATIWDLLSGLLSIIAGVMVVTNLFTYLLTEVMLVYLFAGWVTVTGVLRIVSAFQMKKMGGKWLLMLIFGVITLALGCYSFLHFVFTAITLGYMIGFWVMMAGANLFSMGFSMGKKAKT